MAVHVVDELSKDLKYGRVVDLKLLVHPIGYLVCGIAVEVLAGRHKVLLYACQSCVLSHI